MGWGGMAKGGVPDRWEDYSNMGTVVEGTQFIPFKVPLDDHLLIKVKEGVDKWGLEQLVEAVPQLGLVVDLTNTSRYYPFKKLEGMGVRYCKIFTKGHEVPDKGVVEKFYKAVEEMDEGKTIGVHCTHGLNRTGYLICRFMVEKKGTDPEVAIEAFNRARGHKQERENYLHHLRSKAWEKEPARSERGGEESQGSTWRGGHAQRGESYRGGGGGRGWGRQDGYYGGGGGGHHSHGGEYHNQYYEHQQYPDYHLSEHHHQGHRQYPDHHQHHGQYYHENTNSHYQGYGGGAGYGDRGGGHGYQYQHGGGGYQGYSNTWRGSDYSEGGYGGGGYQDSRGRDKSVHGEQGGKEQEHSVKHERKRSSSGKGEGRKETLGENERVRRKSGGKEKEKKTGKEVQPNLVSRRVSSERKFTIPRKDDSSGKVKNNSNPERSRRGSETETGITKSAKKESSKSRNERKRKKKRDKKLIQTEGIFS